MSGELSWYIARAGGFLAWALSAFSILWGLLITSRALGKRISGPRLLDLHRFIGGLSLVFVFIHMLGLKLHHYKEIRFGFKELVIPMASDWHPGAMAYGIVAFYLLIAVEVTSLLRRKLPARIWRSVHYSGFAVFLLGSIHALKAGTDVQNPLIWWPSAILCAAIVGLAVTRAMAAAQEASGRASGTDVELELFATPPAELPALVPLAPVPEVAARPRDPVAEALASARPIDDRAALLERTRRSLERLDITAYPQPELPPELLTTRPVAEPVASTAAAPAEVELPTRPTDIALRYARLRNPANPKGAVPPSFQAVIPPGANNQSGWGQPPEGWDAPSATPTITPEPVLDTAPPVEIEPAPLPTPVGQQFEFTPFADIAPFEAPVREIAEIANAFSPFEADEPASILVEPEPFGLPDPQSRTAWQDQWSPPASSLDWRTPTRAPEGNGHYADEEPGAADDDSVPANVNTRNGLPSRTPQRLARSTQPARTPLDWKPQRLDTAPMGGAPPPPTPDPATGEVPAEDYRTWLREWLAFAENYEG
jgi:DMSO/TMAO reductase YedYZ heme-binding membrane subunit